MELTRQERWSIIIGMLGLITTFGLARFIYTPLLPLMQADLGFGEQWAGVLAAVNYIGYLCILMRMAYECIVIPFFHI